VTTAAATHRTLLAAHTTLGVGGPAAELVVARTRAELVEAVADADAAGQPVLVLGGGSNVVIGDRGFDGRVVLVGTRGVRVAADDACGGVQVHVAAGEGWPDLVDRAVAAGWRGVEALAGIPGSTGASPVQNIGAYGQQVADTVESVLVFDRRERRERRLPWAACGFGYRTSVFKETPGRHVVLEVVFTFRVGSDSAPVRYGELAAALGIDVGARASAAAVRDSVLALRRGKGMVLDPADPDTASVGSFFTNPVLPAAAVPVGAPAWAQPDGRVKTSAAWLIEHSGFPRGWPGVGAARLSSKHSLAITNRGGATAADVLALARTLRDGVRDAHGVSLEPEPALVGCTL